MSAAGQGLTGKVAIVTGAGRGVGLAIAGAMAQAGAHVLVASRKAPLVEQATASLAKLPGRAAGLALELDDPNAPAQVLAAALSHFGRVDILVNCAGKFVVRPFLELTEQDWMHSLGTNLTTPFRLTQTIARQLVAQHSGGAIINIASVHSHVGDAAVVAQSASKAGLIGLTRATAEALREHDIRVNAIAPGAIEPDSSARAGASPRSRVTQRDVAELAVYLASDKARTITGTTVELYGITRPTLAGH